MIGVSLFLLFGSIQVSRCFNSQCHAFGRERKTHARKVCYALAIARQRTTYNTILTQINWLATHSKHCLIEKQQQQQLTPYTIIRWIKKIVCMLKLKEIEN